MDVKHLSAFQGFSAEKLQKHNVFKSGRVFLTGEIEPQLSANERIDRMFWALGFRGRPARELTEVLAELGAGMDEEAKAQEQMLTSNDFSEAITAFIEKRPPRFTGS